MISYPDVKVNSSMYTDLAIEFASRGYEVFVAVANGRGKTSLNIEGGVTVLRVKTMELFKTSVLKKGFANLILPFQVTFAIDKFFNGVRFDAIVASTPPITYLGTIQRLKKKFKPIIYLVLRDIFPQNAKDLGLIKNKILFAYFRKQEKLLYSISDYIGCMSQGNKNYVIKHNSDVSPVKIHLLPNWKNIAVYTQPDENLKSMFGLVGKYIALYGGNMGKPQKIDSIIELASKLVILKDVVFLLIGEGSEKKRIADLIEERKLLNVKIMDPLPRLQYQELVKICDVGLVNLHSDFTIPNIPSRTLSYWEAKIPVLASIDPNTDFSSILEQSGSGLWNISDDIDAYIKNFEKLYYDKTLRISMGEMGYRYLLDNCQTSHAFEIISNKLNSAGN